MSRPAPTTPRLTLVGDDAGPGPGLGRNGAGWGRRRNRPGRSAFVGSFTMHGALLAFLVGAALVQEPPLPELIVYRVELVSPPPREEGPPEPQVTVPEPPRAMEQPPEPPPPQPTPEPPPPPPRVDPPPEPVAEAPPPRGPDPVPDARVAGEGLEIRLEGEEFPYPEYLANIIRQFRSYFRWTGTPNLSAEVYFVIRRDGSVEMDAVRVLRRSGNVAFDLQVRGAIEAAGRQRAFGALPSGYRADMLPVAIEVRPEGGW